MNISIILAKRFCKSLWSLILVLFFSSFISSSKILFFSKDPIENLLIYTNLYKIWFFSALPQQSRSCRSENRQKCFDLFKGKKPSKSECNGCEQCTKCGGVGFLKTFLGSTKFVKDIVNKCSYCDGGVLACKQNCIANIDNCLACF